MFRAKRKDGQGEVKGWLFYRDVKGYKKAFILQDVWTMTGYNDRKIWMFDEIEVIPSTISMKTYQLDKAKEMIYGSFDLEGFGMTNDGDRAKFKDDSGTWQVGNVSTYEGHMKFMLFADDGDDEGNQDKELHPFDIDEVEIIGKQYDEEK